MKKYILIITALLLISCDKKSKVEKAVEDIPMEMKVIRFDQKFFETPPQDLPLLKTQYPFFFDPATPDQVWLDKMQNKDWKELYAEVQKKYKDFNPEKEDIENLFRHIKYYFPQVKTPQIYTVISEMDQNSKAIYANDKLLIALELYLGKDHKFYAEFPAYLKQNFEQRQILPDVVQSFADGIIVPPRDNSFMAQMIYSGKALYLKDVLIPDYTDAERIGYTEDQIKWSQENESYIWRKFIEDKILFSSDGKLASRYLNLAPFSKFYLEIDNESPGRIGQWIGWQIVRSFVENNPEVKLQDMLKMDGKELFEKSKYKPKKNE
jgi:gliding motility-associated lipoprotein GldB